MIILCINQIFRPTRRNLYRREGVGECVDCSYDPENNPKCLEYYPITLTTYEVKDE